MHVSGFPLDLNWFLQFILTAFLISVGLLHLVKNTASKYFMVDANFESSDPASPLGGSKMPGVVGPGGSCVVCGNFAKNQCSGCKMVRYCSGACQSSHWKSGHKTKCKSGKVNSVQSASKRRASSLIALIPAAGTTNIIKQSNGVLFPYEDFVELFNWNKPGFPPCGLLNCGNSCFANVVLQCLSCTRPLVAYLLEKGHRKTCRRNDWCFLCEFEAHVVRASESRHPFSPINILSRLPNIGGNLGYGKQEDAHEFMRFAIGTMQSVCLDEFGGEKAIDPSTQETTLIQHIFGGHLQSQVICTKCNNISNQYENMMDLTVEIHGDAASLEECLDQFTVRERLHGDNMYKCDGCNDYVMAWKRLTVRQAPNILTIALKRFQSGRFGKLNKRVTFPETLDLSPYMSEAGDGNDVYKLYAVVVHVDMLNASFFGHYICYTKDFCGNWYRIDDCKVTRVDLEDVLSEGAYMLFYSRVSARPSCLKSFSSSAKEQQTVPVVLEEPSARQSVECFTSVDSFNSISISGSLSSDSNSHAKVSTCEEELSIAYSEDLREDTEMVDSEPASSVPQDIDIFVNGHSNGSEETASPVVHANKLVSGTVSSLSLTIKPEACTQNSESSFPNSGVDDENGADSGASRMTDSSSESSLLSLSAKVLADSSSESYLPMQNGICERGNMSQEASVGSFSSDMVMDEMLPVDSAGEPEKMETGKLAVKIFSGAKSKPLFAPGFLGKRPSKSAKRDGKTPSGQAECTSLSNPNKGINGSFKPGFLNQNGSRILGARMPHFECSSSSRPLEEDQVGNCSDKDMMVCSNSDEFTNLCNGGSGAFVIPDVGVGKLGKDDQLLVGKRFSCNGKLCEPIETSGHEKMETDPSRLVEREP